MRRILWPVLRSRLRNQSLNGGRLPPRTEFVPVASCSRPVLSSGQATGSSSLGIQVLIKPDFRVRHKIQPARRRRTASASDSRTGSVISQDRQASVTLKPYSSDAASFRACFPAFRLLSIITPQIRLNRRPVAGKRLPQQRPGACDPYCYCRD